MPCSALESFDMALITGIRSGSILENVTELPDDMSERVAEMRKDPQILLAERVIRSNAKAATVSFTPRVQTPQIRALSVILDNLWVKHLASALEAYAYGWQAFEIGWAVSRGVNYPRELVPLPHAVIPADKMEISEGKVKSITLKGEKEEDKIVLTRPYFWISTVERTALKPLGTAQFAGAVEECWKEHRELTKRRREFAKRHVLGNTIVRAPQWEMRADKGGAQVEVNVHSEIQTAMQSANAGDAMILSSERIYKADGSEGDYKISIEREGGECKDASPLISLIDSVADEVLLANGIPPKTLVEGDGVGSFALVSQQMQLLMNRVESIFAAVHESFVEYVVKEACKLNTGNGSAIESTFTPIAERPDDMGREIVKAWMTSPQLSPLVLSGAIDAGAMLKAQGIPVTQKFEAELAKLRMQPAPSVAAMSLPDTWRGW